MPTKEKWARMSDVAKERDRARNRAYYYANRERRLSAAIKWSKDHPEIIRARARSYGRNKYAGLNIGGGTRIGICPLCSFNGQLIPDHDHMTGEMRDWICRSCNLQLGQFEIRELDGRHNKFREYLGRFK